MKLSISFLFFNEEGNPREKDNCLKQRSAPTCEVIGQEREFNTSGQRCVMIVNFLRAASCIEKRKTDTRWIYVLSRSMKIIQGDIA